MLVTMGGVGWREAGEVGGGGGWAQAADLANDAQRRMKFDCTPSLTAPFPK